jgi:hypothetical protein
VTVSIQAVYGEFTQPDPPEDPKDCSEEENPEQCLKENSDKIEEYIKQFEEPNDDILGSIIEVDLFSEEDKQTEKISVEVKGGVFSEKSYTIKTKLGIHFLL